MGMFDKSGHGRKIFRGLSGLTFDLKLSHKNDIIVKSVCVLGWQRIKVREAGVYMYTRLKNK